MIGGYHINDRGMQRWVAGLLLAWLLTGCGWHLRGSVDLPQDLGIYVDSPDERLRDTWRQELGSAGVPIAGWPEEADYKLVVARESFQDRVLSVDAATGKTQEFELSYSVLYRVERPDGTVIVPPSTARILRSLLLDPTAALGTEREAQIMHQEMRRAAAQQILRRLQLATRNPTDAPQP